MKKSITHSRRMLVGAVAAVLLSMGSQAHAQTFSGTAGGTYDWAAGTDWSATPASGLDTALVYSGTLADGAAIISNNDIASPPFLLNSLSFTNAGTAPTTPAETITLQGGQLEFVTNSSAATPTLSVNLGTPAPAITINNNLVLTNNLGVGGSSNFTLGGVISGAGVLTKNGAGTLTLSGNNSGYAAGVTVSAGTVIRSTSASALGTNTVKLGGGSANAILGNTVGSNITNNIEVLSTTPGNTLTLQNNGSSSSYTGAITLGNDLTIRVGGTSTNRSVIASGLITGSSTITTLANSGGSAQITNVGNAATFTGDVIISQRQLRFNNGSLGTVGTITFGSGTLPELIWNDGNTEDVSSRLVLPASASGIARLNVAANNVTFNTGLSGASGITKLGVGTLTMEGDNTYLGATTVSFGTLLVNGDSSDATGAVTVDVGATLGGSGTIGGATTILGHHSPGTSPGLQTFVSDLNYDAGSSFTFELAANSVINRGDDFDGVNVGGNLDFDLTTTMNLVFNAAGSTVDWSNAFWDTSRSWLVWDVAGSTSDFSALALANINWADAQGDLFNDIRVDGSFSLSQNGQDISLNYVIPEPASLVLLLVSGIALLALRRR